MKEIMLRSIVPFSCNTFTIKIDYEERRNLQPCDSNPSTNIKNAVGIGAASIGILEAMMPEFAVPIGAIGALGAIIFKSIFDISCNGNNALTLDAEDMAHIAHEHFKKDAKRIYINKMEKLAKKIDYLPESSEGDVPSAKLLESAMEYLEISEDALMLEFAGYQTSVVALSHALNLLRLVADAANSAGETECVEQIQKFVRHSKGDFLDIEIVNTRAFEDLRMFMKNDISIRYVKRWFFCNILKGDKEYEAYKHDHSGAEAKETKVRLHNTRHHCLRDQHIKSHLYLKINFLEIIFF